MNIIITYPKSHNNSRLIVSIIAVSALISLFLSLSLGAGWTVTIIVWGKKLTLQPFKLENMDPTIFAQLAVAFTISSHLYTLVFSDTVHVVSCFCTSVANNEFGTVNTLDTACSWSTVGRSYTCKALDDLWPVNALSNVFGNSHGEHCRGPSGSEAMIGFLKQYPHHCTCFRPFLQEYSYQLVWW